MKIKNITRQFLPPREIQTLEIRDRAGSYFQHLKHGARMIVADVQVIQGNRPELRLVVEEVGDILNTPGPVPIIFDDEPDRTYFGMVIGETDLGESNTVAMGEGSITFICFDPYKYGPETTSPMDANNSLAYLNDTNTDIFPVYTITATKDATFVSVIGDADDEVIMIGDPGEVTKTVVPKEQKILDEGFNSLAGWSSAGTFVDNGVVSGTIAITADGKDFYPSSHGAGSGWHGPALMKSLSEQLQDFKLGVYLENKGFGANEREYAQKVGRVVVSLLDINNNEIAMMAIRDSSGGSKYGVGEVRLGPYGSGRYVMNTSHPGWHYFDGYFEIKRVGKRFDLVVSKWYQNKYIDRKVASFYDTKNEFQGKVAKVMVHFGAYGTAPATSQLLDTMRVWKINPVTTIQTPYVIENGDVIEIDTSVPVVRKNGHAWMEEISPISKWFPLHPGTNKIQIMPSDIGTSSMTHKKRWL
jgi:predicted phage tail component-like protein